MIASVTGVVAGLSGSGVVVLVGGVGLAVQTTPGTRARLRTGDTVTLATSLVVREDSLTLFGFETADEQEMFDLLQTASGVGPKVAQAVLTVHTPDAVRRALATEDLTALCLVPGIGRKGAQRMVLELRDKIGAIAGSLDPGRLRGLARHPGRRPHRLGLVAAAGRRGGRAVVGRAAGGHRGRRPGAAEAGVGDDGPMSDSLQAREAAELALRSAELARVAEGLVQAKAQPGEDRVDAALRPKRLAEFVGQERVREQLSLVLESAQRRGRPPDHVLLSGAPGLGKTSLAMIIAAELGTGIRITSGPALERAGDLAALVSSLSAGEVLFIDEIHRIARPAEELLYVAMEDFRVDVIVGKGPGATAIPLEVEPFTLVGATTRSGLLTGPLRDRFGFTAHMEPYSPAELERVLARSAGLLDVPIDAAGAAEIAGRSRGTPRIANRLLRRVRDFAEVRADGAVTRDVARAALAVYDVDELGLDRLDRAVLEALVHRFGGGPVGLSTLAVAVSEEAETVEEVCEPFLVRSGLIARTPRGRVATPSAWRHLGLRPPGPVDVLPLDLGDAG